MDQEWNESLFQRWLRLRDTFKACKRNKNWRGVIEACNDILQLDSQAKFIQIMTPLFHKEIANAYFKLNDVEAALKYFRIAKDDFIQYRKRNKLQSPTDWLDEIDKIEKKIEKLARSIATQ